jgi:hypothetical protein
MPRPTPAQLAYGSVTVVCSTFAMLLLSGVTSGTGIMVIAVAALALGLLVALTAPMGRTARGARGRAATTVAPASASTSASAGSVSGGAAAGTRVTATEPLVPLRRGGPAGARPQVSLRR